MRGVIENFGPPALGLATLVILVVLHGNVVSLSAAGQIDFTNLFAAVFDWSAIQTGFLFAVLGYVSGKSDGFIAAIKGTGALAAFNRFTLTAIILGFVLTFFSIPMVVVAPKVHDLPIFWYAVFAAWGGLAVWAFFAFARVAYIFGLMLKPKERTAITG